MKQPSISESSSPTASSGKLRILHIRNCRGITTLTGPETYLLDLVRFADTSDVNLTVAVIVNSKYDENPFVDKLHTMNARTEILTTNGALDFSDLKFLRQYTAQKKPDLLVTHDARSDFIAWLAGSNRRPHWVAFAHGWVNWKSRLSKDYLYSALEASAVQHADDVVVASNHMKEDLLNRGIPEYKLHQIPIGINVDKYRQNIHPEQVRSELGLSPGTPLIGLVGRIHPWKGQDIFVQAASKVLRTRPDARFLLVGDTAFPEHLHYREEIESLIRELDLAQQVRLTGTRHDIPSVMAALDICAVPSLNEPYGLVAIEAQAAGTPVVASDVGGLSEVVANNVTGCLVQAGDAEALAQAMINLVQDRERSTELGRQGQNRANKRYSARVMAELTVKFYHDVLSTD